MTDTPAPAPGHIHRVGFVHRPAAWIAERRTHKPVQTSDQPERLGFNGRVGVLITTVVGTMWAAYVFTCLALVGLPAALGLTWLPQQSLIIVAWVAQTFLQLVLLPIIIVGQNVQAAAADKRSVQTFKDAEAILAECLALQTHLEDQDRVLDDIIRHLKPEATSA
jgi:hypothetical protein